MTTPLTIDLVHWERRARGNIPHEADRRRLAGELVAMFAPDGIERVTVHDAFMGFKKELLNKVILGVQTLLDGEFQSHIDKLGDDSEVGRDFEGWQECVARRNLRSRLLAKVSRSAIPARDSERLGEPPVPRSAVHYENAYELFGFQPDEQR